MESLQELIFRARFVMANAPGRLEVFDSVNGKRTTIDIAKLVKRHVNNVRRDLTLLADAGLIQPVLEKGASVKRNRFPVYEKVPLARTIPLRYFSTPAKLASNVEISRSSLNTSRKNSNVRAPKPLAFPTEDEILQLAKSGEDQLHEFKGQGTEMQKITREIAAMLNTYHGGIILYGVDDSGTIEGSDFPLQKFDQSLQNSVRNAISPSATIKLKSIQVLGHNIIAILVPPWNKKNVYQYNEKVLIRRGTNAFAAKPDELRELHSGKYVT